MTDEYLNPDGNVLMSDVEMGLLNFVERVTGNGDATVVEKESLDE